MSNLESAHFDENNLTITTTTGNTPPPDVSMRSPTSATMASTGTTTTTAAISLPNSPRSIHAGDEVDAAISRNNNNNNSPKEITPQDTNGVRYGKCKWFNVAKGWGFITPNDGGQEVFVHQSIIQMDGFRSLGEQEDVEFECKRTERGFEATRVSGRAGIDCHGSTFHPNKKKNRSRRVRCYNCGEFANHIASKCELGPQPKSCHLCKLTDHLFADCPMQKTQTTSASNSANESMLSAQSEESGNVAGVRVGCEGGESTIAAAATKK